LPAATVGWCRPRVEPDRKHPCDVGVGIGDRRARFEAGETRIAEAADPHTGPIERDQRDHLGGGLHVQKPEPLGHDADHLDRGRVGDQSPSDYRAVAAEPPLPVGVSQDDHRSVRRRAGRAVCLGEDATELRLHSQCLQDVVRHKQRARLLGLSDASDRTPAVAVQTDLLKDAPLLAIGEVLRRRQAQFAHVETWRDLPDADELAGVWV
jgi:hypothetical protein